MRLKKEETGCTLYLSVYCLSSLLQDVLHHRRLETMSKIDFTNEEMVSTLGKRIAYLHSFIGVINMVQVL